LKRNEEKNLSLASPCWEKIQKAVPYNFEATNFFPLKISKIFFLIFFLILVENFSLTRSKW